MKFQFTFFCLSNFIDSTFKTSFKNPFSFTWISRRYLFEKIKVSDKISRVSFILLLVENRHASKIVVRGKENIFPWGFFYTITIIQCTCDIPLMKLYSVFRYNINSLAPPILCIEMVLAVPWHLVYIFSYKSFSFSLSYRVIDNRLIKSFCLTNWVIEGFVIGVL